MNILIKRRILGLATGVAILAGTMCPFVASASPKFEEDQQAMAAMHQRHVDPDKFAQKISDTFGVNKEDVLKYQKAHIGFRDIFRAAFLAKASGKSLTEIMQTKTYDNTWKDVAQSLGITKEQMKATHNDIAANKLEKKLQIPKQTSLDLLQQGYHPRDIAVANALANNTGKQIADVLAQKKINNSWADVANTLGVDENTFKQVMETVRAASHPRDSQNSQGPQGLRGRHGPQSDFF